jgi:hypothetical protein
MSDNTTVDFCTNGYPDPDMFWAFARARVALIDAHIFRREGDYRERRLLLAEMATAGVD